MSAVFDFKNKNQAAFYDDVIKTVARIPGYVWRYFFYGGAIRGGKTFVCLYIFLKLAKLYPNSRWHVFREDNTALDQTTIPSMQKLVGPEYPGCGFKWKSAKGSVQLGLRNGSKIFFKSENFKQDPELNGMLGLETNGIILEQLEALSEKIMGRAIERLGSWYITPMPVPIILGTFNPTNLEHVKKKIYDKWAAGTLAPPWYFRQALPSDNPHVTEEQWKGWENLDEENRMVMINGIWRFQTDGKRFAYAFDEKKTVVDILTKEGAKFMTPNPALPLNLVFDFNVDPITCIVCQHHGMYEAKVFQEYRLRNSDIFELLERIYTDWEGYFFVINADASGRNRSALTKGNRTYVITIQKFFKLKPTQIQIPRANPSVTNTRVLMNSLFSKHPKFWIASRCVYLINDLNNVVTDEKGKIEKDEDKLRTHLLDTLRYFMWYYFYKFVPFYPIDVDKDEQEQMDRAA